MIGRFGLIKKARRRMLPSLYQRWVNGFPDSPLLTSAYPYQAIASNPGQERLFLADWPIHVLNDDPTTAACYNNGWHDFREYYLNGGAWIYLTANYSSAVKDGVYLQANNNVFTDETCGTVYFAKTT